MTVLTRVILAGAMAVSAALFGIGAMAQDTASETAGATSAINFGEASQLTALGALILVLIFIVVKLLPSLMGQVVAMTAQVAEAQKEQSKIFSSTVQTIIDEWNKKDERRDKDTAEAQRAHTEAIRALAVQCAEHQAKG